MLNFFFHFFETQTRQSIQSKYFFFTALLELKYGKMEYKFQTMKNLIYS